MPQTHPTASTTGLMPVPVAVLLPTRDGHRAKPAGSELPDWHGVTARDAAGLITRLSSVGDLVGELDGHPTITRAAEHLGRRSAATLPGLHVLTSPVPGCPALTRPSRWAGLIFAELPRPDAAPGDLDELSATMQTLRAGLRPGGYVLTALTARDTDQGVTEHPVIYRAGVIAAARTAGLGLETGVPRAHGIAARGRTARPAVRAARPALGPGRRPAPARARQGPRVPQQRRRPRCLIAPRADLGRAVRAAARLGVAHRTGVLPERYRSHLDIHILPRFGDMPLNAITRMAVKRWLKDLNHRRADSTVASILSLLSMIMGEAVEERRIAMNPCRRLRNSSTHRPERPWANAEQVNEIAARIAAPNQVLIITAAYTGMRWGELAGLRRRNCQLDGGRIFIDPDEGNLHEVGGRLTLGPPKTPAAARDILLPPFLIELLRAYLDSHHHDHVFTGRDGGLHRRSSFHRRHWRPATDGDPAKGVPAVIRGLHFHDLRHSHKTWLIEDGVPEVAQAKRLGHRLPGVRGIYSHVSAAVEQRLVDGLQARWERQPRPGDNISN